MPVPPTDSSQGDASPLGLVLSGFNPSHPKSDLTIDIVEMLVYNYCVIARGDTMKKVIQVPIDENLLNELNDVSKRQERSRADLIREACQHYLRSIEAHELDTAYQQGYERIPEEAISGEAQLAVMAQVLPVEDW